MKPRLLFSDAKGRVFDFPGLEAAGMKAGEFYRLDPAWLVPLPAASELFMLPDRAPVGFNGAQTVALNYSNAGPKVGENLLVFDALGGGVFSLSGVNLRVYLMTNQIVKSKIFQLDSDAFGRLTQLRRHAAITANQNDSA